MESSILSEVHNASILRAGLSTDYAVIPTSLASQIVAGLSACPPAQRAGAKRLRALYRFLDAGSPETFRMHGRPASKKRRGTKSREGWRRVGGARYGDLMRGPVRWGLRPWSEATCAPARGSGRESETSVSAGCWRE